MFAVEVPRNTRKLLAHILALKEQEQGALPLCRSACDIFLEVIGEKAGIRRSLFAQRVRVFFRKLRRRLNDLRADQLNILRARKQPGKYTARAALGERIRGNKHIG
jgi:hypothetical protein